MKAFTYLFLFQDISRMSNVLLLLQRMFQLIILHLNHYYHISLAFHSPQVVQSGPAAFRTRNHHLNAIRDDSDTWWRKPKPTEIVPSEYDVQMALESRLRKKLKLEAEERRRATMRRPYSKYKPIRPTRRNRPNYSHRRKTPHLHVDLPSFAVKNKSPPSSYDPFAFHFKRKSPYVARTYSRLAVENTWPVARRRSSSMSQFYYPPKSQRAQTSRRRNSQVEVEPWRKVYDWQQEMQDDDEQVPKWISLDLAKPKWND